jgi:hypothetical protein
MYVSRKKYIARGGAWPQLLRYMAMACVVTFTITYLFRSRSKKERTPSKTPPIDYHLPPYKSDPARDVHTIDYLIRNAQQAQNDLMAKQSHTLEDATRRYRERRGRHPPPGFDKWFEHAQKNDAIVVEDFWDRVYHDLRPFWAIPAAEVKVTANTYVQRIRVRNGSAVYVTDNPNRVPWIQLWHAIVKEAAPYLPDVDMPINYMDETRVLVPWDTINKYVEMETSRRKMPPPEQVISSYPGLQELDKIAGPPFNPNWINNDAARYWDHARQSCHPESPSRNISAVSDFAEPIEFPSGWPSYSHHGYIQNWTQAQDPCLQPHLRSMHGTFVESVSMSTTHELIPLFGGSKLPMNNDILIPGAMYLTDEERYRGADLTTYDWIDKMDKLIWRGVASGGRNRDVNWHHFHRHRFVQSLNGTTIKDMEETGKPAKTFDLPYPGTYDLEARRDGTLGDFVSDIADVAFIHLECFPAEFDPNKQRSTFCSYTNPWYAIRLSMPMKQQFFYKYLPDIDGNSFSGRWRSFLMSTSMPLKATIYKEWHDDRLMPWVHFVPFDNSYQDIYGIMDYFLHGHDLAAYRVAIEGKEWAEKVLRREDMMLYVWRLLLEFARICDDNRDRLGYVEDLL